MRNASFAGKGIHGVSACGEHAIGDGALELLDFDLELVPEEVEGAGLAVRDGHGGYFISSFGKRP